MVDVSGLDVYRVGGAVRDGLLGREPSDEDFVVVGVSPGEMVERGFDRPVGESFAVFIHPETGDEWALARTEESTGSGLCADGSVSLEEDLGRRDLTINAMAEDVESGEIVDPYGGREDLEAGVLRHVSEAFAEDPLRVLRVAAFAARLPGFEVHSETAEFCCELVPRLESVSAHRVREEIVKVFRKAEAPRRFFDVLQSFGALEVVFPVLTELDEVPAGPEEFHGEGSAFEHTMRVLEEARSLRPDNSRVLWAALGHDLGKLETDEEELPSHPGHGKAGSAVVERFADGIKLGNERRRVMYDAARFHMRFGRVCELREATLIRMVEQMGEPSLTVDEFVVLGVADGRGREPQDVGADVECVWEHLEAAERVIDAFGGEEAFEKFDLDGSEGEKIGKLILQERVRLLKEERPG